MTSTDWHKLQVVVRDIVDIPFRYRDCSSVPNRRPVRVSRCDLFSFLGARFLIRSEGDCLATSGQFPHGFSSDPARGQRQPRRSGP